jgi:hypothetical protein
METMFEPKLRPIKCTCHKFTTPDLEIEQKRKKRTGSLVSDESFQKKEMINCTYGTTEVRYGRSWAKRAKSEHSSVYQFLIHKSCITHNRIQWH